MRNQKHINRFSPFYMPAAEWLADEQNRAMLNSLNSKYISVPDAVNIGAR